MPYFNPDRLRTARLAVNMSLDDLAQKMEEYGHNISRQALHQFEKGKNNPAPSTFRALALSLNLRPSELMNDSFNLQFIAFRKTSSLGIKEKEAIQSEFTWKAEHRVKLLSINSATPRFSIIDKRRVDVPEEAEAVARYVRSEWRLGRDAISSITDAFEHNGIEVLCLEPSNNKFSGLSAYDATNGIAFVGVQHRENDGGRQRMDLAHELAHLVLDSQSPVDEEAFAARFAGAFLLPDDIVFAELGKKRSDLSFTELQSLKVRYGVSMQGWVRRAKDLHIISDETYKKICIRFSVTHRRSDEGMPYVAPESCDRDFRLASRALIEGLISIEEAARLANVDIKEFKMETSTPHVKAKASLSRERRRIEAKRAAEMSAIDYNKYPEDRVPDVIDYAD